MSDEIKVSGEHEFIPQDVSVDEKEMEEHKVPPSMIAAIKKEIIEELKSDEARQAEEAKQRREKQKEEHDKYIEMMKASPDPWVEIEGWVDTPQGVRVELEWNDSFVDNLRQNGISGVDDEQVVQKWVALLMHDMAHKIDEEHGDYE